MVALVMRVCLTASSVWHTLCSLGWKTIASLTCTVLVSAAIVTTSFVHVHKCVRVHTCVYTCILVCKACSLARYKPSEQMPGVGRGWDGMVKITDALIEVLVHDF